MSFGTLAARDSRATKGDSGRRHRNETAVGDGDAMGVTGKIGKDLFGPCEGRFGEDDHSLRRGASRCAAKPRAVSKGRETIEEAELATARCAACKHLQEQPAIKTESTRTGRKNPGRQATQVSPSGASPPPGTMQWTCG